MFYHVFMRVMFKLFLFHLFSFYYMFFFFISPPPPLFYFLFLFLDIALAGTKKSISHNESPQPHNC